MENLFAFSTAVFNGCESRDLVGCMTEEGKTENQQTKREEWKKKKDREGKTFYRPWHNCALPTLQREVLSRAAGLRLFLVKAIDPRKGRRLEKELTTNRSFHEKKNQIWFTANKFLQYTYR